MSVPSILALTWGTSCNALTTALIKKLMKPSLVPYRSWYAALNCLRSSITEDMSHSLKVVRMAAWCWASTNRAAMVRRNGLMGFLMKRGEDSFSVFPFFRRLSDPVRMFSFPAFVPGRLSQVRRNRKRVSPAFPVVRRAVRRNFRQGGKCGLKPRRWGLPPLPGRGFPARRFHPPPNPWKPCPFPASPECRL